MFLSLNNVVMVSYVCTVVCGWVCAPWTHTYLQLPHGN